MLSEWSCVRPQGEIHAGDDNVQLLALPGTLWMTQEKRSAVNWDAPDARNLFLSPSIGDEGTLTVDIEFTPKSFGEQAGVHVYVSDEEYVKVVVEGMKKSPRVALVIAKQSKGEPQVMHKHALAEDAVSVSVRLRVSVDKVRKMVKCELANESDDAFAQVGETVDIADNLVDENSEVRFCLAAYGAQSTETAPVARFNLVA
ncbi:MAG: hypothetical protein MHM6MM_002499 [Cercozoa sp. M6MM]